MRNLAPICISVYSRLEHLRKNISALRNNKLARYSHLYIFSDGPKPGDEIIVERLRTFLYEIQGFKKIHIFERERNNYIHNALNGIEYLLDKYQKVIFLEEDIVTTPGFLTFINDALEYFSDNPNIFSITGYAPPIDIELHCKSDFFVLPRFNAWGFGIWKDRYESIRKFTKKDLNQLLKRRSIRKYIKNFLGEDVLLMLLLETENTLNAWDIKAMYQQILNRKYTIYPKISLVNNIGNDGSGIHCIATDKYKTGTWDKTSFVFNSNITLNQAIAKAHGNFRKLNRRNKLICIAKRYHIYSIIKSVKSFLIKKNTFV